MKNNIKKVWFIPMLFIALISCFMLTSCSNDGPSSSDIVGKWYGTRTYHNPVSGTKYQYLTLEFESNGTGSLEYESPTSYSIARFKYSIKGNTINCNGAYANTSGEVEDDFSMSLLIEGDRIIPQNKYTQFILTRDNSVMTDSNGNEIGKDSDNSGNDNSGTSTGAIIDGKTREEIMGIIKQNVTVEASYSEYMWHFRVESALAKFFPSHTITYGIGHGDVNGVRSVSIGNEAYKYSYYKSGDKMIMDFTNPFWYYFIFGVKPMDGETLTRCQMYYASYVRLKEEGLSNLSKEDKDLYNTLVSELNKYESETKYNYKPTVDVLIDDTYFFTIGTYSR